MSHLENLQRLFKLEHPIGEIIDNKPVFWDGKEKDLGNLNYSVYISQLFGKNPQMYSQFGMIGHNGIDYGVAFKLSLIPYDITISYKIEDNNPNGYGYQYRGFTEEKEDYQLELVFGHFSKLYVNVGNKIKKGEKAGITGNTGYSTGPHLHYGVRAYHQGKILNYNNGYFGYIDPLLLIGNIEELPEWKPFKMDNEFFKKHKGKIFIATERNGEAFYLSPKDNQVHYLGRPDEAFKIMKEHGIGISNEDLSKIVKF